ncbi:MAG: hypothetical protein ICV53_03060 [Flavisolibacter sp.]|nr:hypothetical protein [Flavisolibacter sp.]MBD0365068.1 hypothetical protein [Flavisolibacter sp.]
MFLVLGISIKGGFICFSPIPAEPKEITFTLRSTGVFVKKRFTQETEGSSLAEGA